MSRVIESMKNNRKNNHFGLAKPIDKIEKSDIMQRIKYLFFGHIIHGNIHAKIAIKAGSTKQK